jgi:arabinofuranosyltransferase
MVFAALAISRRWTHDDGFINLRIVRNIVDGYGPVFNPGERVEVGTSPLWLAVLALVHALGAPLEASAMVLGIACTSLAVLLLPLVATRATRAERGLMVPVGVVLFVAVPATWDYASGGLETGLSCLWLAAAAALVVRAADRTATARRGYLTATFVGLGVLVRPDYLLYSTFFLAVLWWAGRRRETVRTGGLLASAFVLPLGVQLLRMGYYATMSPNTALAKEAFRLNVPQGVCYLRNFVGTYWLAGPLAAALLLALYRLRRIAGRDRLLAAAVAAPAAAALLHAGYLVAIGGDYMHARLLLPDLLAFLIPVGAVRVPVSLASVRTAVPAAAAAIIVGWAPKSALALRVGHENQCGIGDEHGWYLQMAQAAHAVRIDEYQKHPFYVDGQRMKPSGFARSLYAEKDVAELAPSVDARVDRALFAGAIGIVGFSLPSTVHVIDKHGLADPVASRFALAGRGRPGHEKELTNPWVLARFAAPRANDAHDVLAARSALACGEAADLLASVEGPLTAAGFFHNIVRASAHGRLRIPDDPFVAEAALCGHPLERRLTGGPGGVPFTWRCKDGSEPSGLDITVQEKEAAIASVSLACSGRAKAQAFGQPAGMSHPLRCGAGAKLRGIFGRGDTWVREIGLVCEAPGGTIRVPAEGVPSGVPFEAVCDAGQQVGLAGRAGSLVDAAGVVCVR